jgi:hypothetical protein
MKDANKNKEEYKIDLYLVISFVILSLIITAVAINYSNSKFLKPAITILLGSMALSVFLIAFVTCLIGFIKWLNTRPSEYELLVLGMNNKYRFKWLWPWILMLLACVLLITLFGICLKLGTSELSKLKEPVAMSIVNEPSE